MGILKKLSGLFQTNAQPRETDSPTSGEELVAVSQTLRPEPAPKFAKPLGVSNKPIPRRELDPLPGLGAVDFVSVDVETANANLSSICQVGVVAFKAGEIIDVWQSLVDPEDYFDPFNVMIHGITEADVTGAPTFPQVANVLRQRLEGGVAACHTHFDRAAFSRAAVRYGIEPLACTWLDTAAVSRRCWPECARSGYGLANLAKGLRIKYEAHNAAEDARACGLVLVNAIETSGLDVSSWLKRVRQPISGEAFRSDIAMDGNPDGPLFGHTVVFTGALSLPRVEIAQLAAAAGCTVGTDVTKKTTLLIVGDQDLSKLAGNDKSHKHRHAEKLISEGQNIRILGEGDFRHLAGLVEVAPASKSAPTEVGGRAPILLADPHCPHCGHEFNPPAKGKEEVPCLWLLRSRSPTRRWQAAPRET